MADPRTAQRYRKLYARMLRLYPRSFRDRFGEGMEQTFHDLCRERLAEGRPVHAFALGLFVEAIAGIFKERIALMLPSRKNVIRLLAITLALLAVPFVAMRFSGEVNWSAFDFMFAGVMIFGTGMAFLTIAHAARN